MKRFILGFLVGVVATVLFFSLGGSELFVKALGRESIRVEKEVHKSGEAVKEKVGEKAREVVK